MLCEPGAQRPERGIVGRTREPGESECYSQEWAALVEHGYSITSFGPSPRSFLADTIEELFEVLETCLVPGGAPTFHRGLSALMEVKE